MQHRQSRCSGSAVPPAMASWQAPSSAPTSASVRDRCGVKSGHRVVSGRGLVRLPGARASAKAYRRGPGTRRAPDASRSLCGRMMYAPDTPWTALDIAAGRADDAARFPHPLLRVTDRQSIRRCAARLRATSRTRPPDGDTHSLPGPLRCGVGCSCKWRKVVAVSPFPGNHRFRVIGMSGARRFRLPANAAR